MNRKNLTAAVLAGLAGAVGIVGSAQAVNINPDGLGQVLLYPYYTTNGDNLTLLSVVNTANEAKAVKVRFLESQNSVEVLDFNLYMSAYDVWTAAVGTQPEGRMDQSCDPDPSDDTDVYCEGPVLVVAEDENTCMVPQFAKIQSFLPFAYQTEADGGYQGQDRMNEGHFEMIEMGVLTEEGDFDPETMATHVDGIPEDCDGLEAAWTITGSGTSTTPGEWVDQNDLAILPPTGGLFGGAAIVNVWKGAMHTYEATAINGWNASGADYFGASIHTDPSSLQPNLRDGDIPAVGQVFLGDGSLHDSTFTGTEAAVDAVSFLFMHDSLMNEYITDDGLNAATEWVLTFPTKRFYVDPETTGSITARAPFTTAWAPIEDGVLATACEIVGLTGLWDREEATAGDPGCEDTGTCETDKPPVVSPPPPYIPPESPDGLEPFELCYEVNVIRFGAAGEAGVDLPDESEILGKPLGEYLNFDNTNVFKDQSYKYGWSRLELDDYVEDIDESGDYDEDEYFSRADLGELNGLPVIGFAVNRFSNNYLEDSEGNNVLSAYGSLFNHKATRKIGSDDGGPVTSGS